MPLLATKVDAAAKQFNGDPKLRMSPDQQTRLKKLYAEHLTGADTPGSQFVIAARMAGVAPPEIRPPGTDDPPGSGKLNDPAAGFAGSTVQLRFEFTQDGGGTAFDVRPQDVNNPALATSGAAP